MSGLQDSIFSKTFSSPRSAQKVLPKIWPDQVTHPCSTDVICKNHLSRPWSLRGVGQQNNTFWCVLLYVGKDLQVQAKEAQLTLKSGYVNYHMLKNSHLGAKIVALSATERQWTESTTTHSPTHSLLDPFLVPVGSPWVQAPIWPAYNHHLGTAHLICKNHPPSPATYWDPASFWNTFLCVLL